MDKYGDTAVQAARLLREDSKSAEYALRIVSGEVFADATEADVSHARSRHSLVSVKRGWAIVPILWNKL